AGNVLISPEGDLSLIDFGIAGRVDAVQRAALIRFLVGFSRNDTILQLKGLQQFGAVPDDVDLALLAKQLEDQLEAADPGLRNRETNLTVEQLSKALGIVIRILATNGFRLPKELVLF